MPDPEELFRKRMRELREARGWSQRDLATRVKALDFPKMSQAAIALIETGDKKRQRRVRLDEAVAIAAVLDLPLEDLYRQLDWNDYLVAQAEEPGISSEQAWLRAWKYQREKQSTSKEDE